MLVPVNETETMAKLMLMLALPVLVVARTTLGTINHTLLTIEALRRRSIEVAGVIMVGLPNADNREAIERYGCVDVLGEMPRIEPLTGECAGHRRGGDGHGVREMTMTSSTPPIDTAASATLKTVWPTAR